METVGPSDADLVIFLLLETQPSEEKSFVWSWLHLKLQVFQCLI